jgi:hypothetical protein
LRIGLGKLLEFFPSEKYRDARQPVHLRSPFFVGVFFCLLHQRERGYAGTKKGVSEVYEGLEGLYSFSFWACNPVKIWS